MKIDSTVNNVHAYNIIHNSNLNFVSFFKKLAAGSLTFVKAYSSGQASSAIDGLEDELEAEIQREKQTVATSGFARYRENER